MRKKYFFIVIYLFSVVTVLSQQKKILFVGNSYTAYNNLPQLVNDMAESTGIDLVAEMHAPGGTNFMYHAESEQTLAKINSKAWNFVVLQAQSQEPSFGDAQVADEVFPYAEILSNQIKENNACSIPVFYTTWGRKNGDAGNCPFVPEVCTFEGMNNQLINRYTTMANDNDGYISPVAVVWASIRENYPEYELYTSDESHPTLIGSYIAACTFYTILSQEDPTMIGFNATLDPTIANTIKDKVKELVYEDLSTWNVNAYNPIADFEFSQDENEITFTNSSEKSETYVWDFGDDSEVSNEENPIHVFTDAGTYTVTLSSSRCGVESVKTIEVTITETIGIAELDYSKITIYPTIIEDVLFVKGNIEESKIYVYNNLGEIVLKSRSQSEISLSGLKSGIYFIQVLNEKGEKETFKVVKK